MPATTRAKRPAARGAATPRLKAAAMAALTAGGAFLVASPPADAATAPACIIRKIHHEIETANIFNTCGRTMRVQVRIRRGFDSDCETIPHGGGFSFNWGLGSYRKVSTC